MTAAPAGGTLGHPTWQSVASVIAAGIAVAVGALFAIVWMSAQALDRNEHDNETSIARSIVEQLQIGIGYSLLPEANWDDAYRMFVPPLDLNLIRSQIGPDVLATLDLVGAYVFDPADRLVYGFRDRQEFDDRDLPGGASLRIFAQKVRTTLRDQSRPFLTSIAIHNGEFHVLAGSLIVPTTASVHDPKLDGKVMIVDRYVPPSALRALGERFLMSDLGVGPDRTGASISLTDPGGNAAGSLTWTPRYPGRSFLAGAILPIVFVMIALACVSVIGFFKWLKMSEAVQLSHAQALALEQAARMKSILMAHLSHELRTPLNAVIGFAQLLRAECADARKRDYAEDIERNGRRLLGIVNTVLDLARIERGEFEPVIDEIDIERVLRSIIAAAKERAEEGAVSIELNCAEALPTINSDERAIRQVIARLLDNALKFTPRGARVYVVARALSHAVEIQVVDHGPGIDPAVLSRMDTPFGLPDDVMTRQGQGMGLGLALCRALAEKLGASLRIESTVAQGTTVSLRLSVDEASHRHRTEARSKTIAAA